MDKRQRAKLTENEVTSSSSLYSSDGFRTAQADIHLNNLRAYHENQFHEANNVVTVLGFSF